MDKELYKMMLKYIRDNINLDKRFWKHILTTNCYAFALGLDVKEKQIMYGAYQPGIIGKYIYSVGYSKHFSYSSLIESIQKDMDAIGIDIREINFSEEISPEEWKIALFTVFHANEFYSEYLSDFHFLRQLDDGLWYHKPGFYRIPTNKDYKNNIITNPEECYLGNKNFRKCYALKLQK